ncbi:hypothetical protein A7U60_g3210 [Sanghuangporus baumii]|uniref:Uncharacterized protein n=1 Tax=Sanghuangporus baumii TaxID=108892 RepID=A0A9Q5N776_SANBA|nr:hypothetical protein A7U60_g3210 [Sanghuangporus baumii]
MPDHAKYPFSVCLQHDYETVEEYETQYSRDGHTVICWVCDEFLQRADNVRWKSDGIGHPSKIRVLTERAHVTSHRSRINELRVAGLRPTASEPYIKYRMSTERSSLRRHYSDHERLAIPTSDRILTIKIEVTMPRRISASHASGSLPLNRDKLRVRNRRMAFISSITPVSFLSPIGYFCRTSEHHDLRLIGSSTYIYDILLSSSIKECVPLLLFWPASDDLPYHPNEALQPRLSPPPRSPPYIPPLSTALSERQTEGDQDGTSQRDCENSSRSDSSPSASETSTRIATCLTINPKPHWPIELVSMTHVDENSTDVSPDQGLCLLPGERCDRCGIEGVKSNCISCKMAYELEGHLTKIKVCISMQGDS